MMAKPNIEIITQSKLYILFFPFARYTRVGDIRLVKVIGVPVYKQVGGVKWITGVSWGSNG